MRSVRIALPALCTAVCVASCSAAQNESIGLPPTNAQGISPASSKQWRPAAAPSLAVSVSGPIEAAIAGGYTVMILKGCPSKGYLHVYVNASTAKSGPAPAVGKFVEAAGSGTCTSSVTATSLTSFNVVSVSGSVTSMSTGSFTIKTGSTCPGGGNLRIYEESYTATTGAAPAVGMNAAVNGPGSCTSSVAAMSIVTSGSANSGSGSSGSGSGGSTSMKHVLTADYLGSPYGTTSISWAAAAAYLSWAQTATTSANAISSAGIKTQYYVDPNRTTAGTGDQLYTSDETTFAHDCSNKRVTALYNGNTTLYVMNPASASMQALFAKYVSGIAARGHYDALYEDNAGPLSEYAPYDPFSAMPCGYSDAAWISGGEALDQSSGIPIIFNGLSGLNGHSPSLSLGLLGSSNTIGANYEECYSNTSDPKMSAWLWQAIENTELEVAAKGKLFECQARNTNSASSQIDARLYTYASFLLTYAPSTSILWEEFATTSGLHVMPETGLVALSPKVASPASVATLKQSGGTYAREYGQCYLKGSSVGPCAVVVNSDTGTSHPFPFTQYHHTLTITGSGVLDGGSLSVSGPAPASTVASLEAEIVFP